MTTQANDHRNHVLAVYVPATVGYAVSYVRPHTTMPQPLEILPTGDPEVRCLTCGIPLPDIDTYENEITGNRTLIWPSDPTPTVSLTARDWHLYTVTYGTEDTRKTVDALNAAATRCLQYLDRGDAHHEFCLVADQYAQYGAADSEPRRAFLDLWDARNGGAA